MLFQNINKATSLLRILRPSSTWQKDNNRYVPTHRRHYRSVDLNEQLKLESVCICDDLRPQSYLLEIQPLIEEAKFKGRVRINVTWTERADLITLLAHPDLEISQSNVKVTRLNVVIDEDDSSR